MRRHVTLRCVPGSADDAQDLHRALRGVLDKVRLVDDDARRGKRRQPCGIPGEEVVIDHDPARGNAFRQPVVLRAEDLDGGRRLDHADLALPVELERGRADDQPRGGGTGPAEGDDGLPGLAEPHVVGEDGGAVTAQEVDTLDLVRVEAERNAGLQSGPKTATNSCAVLRDFACAAIERRTSRK